jgi:hypothetical protein
MTIGLVSDGCSGVASGDLERLLVSAVDEDR